MFTQPSSIKLHFLLERIFFYTQPVLPDSTPWSKCFQSRACSGAPSGCVLPVVPMTPYGSRLLCALRWHNTDVTWIWWRMNKVGLVCDIRCVGSLVMKFHQTDCVVQCRWHEQVGQTGGGFGKAAAAGWETLVCRDPAPSNKLCSLWQSAPSNKLCSNLRWSALLGRENCCIAACSIQLVSPPSYLHSLTHEYAQFAKAQSAAIYLHKSALYRWIGSIHSTSEALIKKVKKLR